MKQVEGGAVAASHEIMGSENSGAAPKSLGSLLLRHFLPPLPRCFSGLTGVAVVGHEEIPSLSIVAAQLQLQHVWVEPDVAPLDVDGRLFLSTACGVFVSPVHLIQSSLCVEMSTKRK